MSEKIVQLNEEVIKCQIKELVRGSVEETLNELLEAEAEKLTQAARYERNEQRQGYRSGHYSRNLTTTSGDVTLKVPKLKGISFETAIYGQFVRQFFAQLHGFQTARIRLPHLARVDVPQLPFGYIPGRVTVVVSEKIPIADVAPGIAGVVVWLKFF